MAHLWGLDAATPPSAAELARLKSDGWSFFGGYVGGHAARVWTKAEFGRVAAAGMKINAFWVAPLSGDPGYDAGTADGNACLVAMQNRNLYGWVQADVESGLTPREWFRGFVDALHAGSCRVGLYGLRSTIEKLGDLADSWYLAFYPQPMLSEAQQQIIDWDQWQFSDGPAYDYNVARDDFEFTGFTP